MADDTVLFEVHEGVAYVTLNRPDVHNAFDEAVIARLAEIWDSLRAYDDTIAVVLRGNGKSFSAGADANWMRRAAAQMESQNHEDARRLASMLYGLYTLPQATIACVQGTAFGGGLGLASCVDVAVARRDAVFALSEVRLGLIPATIAPYVLRAMGERHARRYFQTGERFDAQKAYDMGLVGILVDDEAGMEKQLAGVLDALRQNGPQAMRASKKLCYDLAGLPLTSALMEETARRIAAVRAGAEAKDGLDAFLEKRKPAWARK